MEPRYQAGHIFFVDSVAALADARQGRAPQGEFAALVDLLTRQFAGAAAARIRRANFLDLAAQALESCRRRLDEAMPAIDNLRAAIDQQRGELSAALAGQIRGELLSARRPWENRLLGQVTSRWGFSPFSLVLRLYQGIGGLASGALLYRARTPAQLALWGVVEGARTWQKHRRNRQVQQRPGRMAAGGFDATQLRRAAVVLEGYAAEAGLPKASASVATLEAEADAASLNFAARLSQDLDALIARQAQRHTGWFTRCATSSCCWPCWVSCFSGWERTSSTIPGGWPSPRRCGAWSRISPRPSGSCSGVFVLLWLFTRRLRGGLRQAIDRLAEDWTGAAAASGVFAELDDDCRRAVEFRRDLEMLHGDVERLRGSV